MGVGTRERARPGRALRCPSDQDAPQIGAVGPPAAADAWTGVMAANVIPP